MWVCLSIAVSFNNSVKMLSAGFLPCKVTIFHFDINKSFVGIFTETKFLIAFHPLVLALLLYIVCYKEDLEEGRKSTSLWEGQKSTSL